MNKRSVVLIAAVLLPIGLSGQEAVDLFALNQIKAEGFERSKVMDYMFYLTDVNGPRLAGSPGYKSAAEWCVKTLKEIGLEDAKLEKWGTLGRGWSLSRFSIHMLAPQATPLIGLPQGWSPGTDGPLVGEVVLAPVQNEADMEKFKGKLKGKIVLIQPNRELALPVTPFGKRYADQDLSALMLAPDPDARRRMGDRRAMMGQYRALREKLTKFLRDEGVLAVLTGGSMGDGGLIFSTAVGTRDAKDPLPPPTVSLMTEHYLRLARLVEKNVPVKVELDIKAQFHDETTDGFNVIGNLPGNRKKDEIVMLGGHLDSWHGATGATDNAAGVAIAMEALRILKTTGVKLDRTVRIGLWDAEEEGLLGSAGYVKQHFGDRETMALKSEHGKLSCYFNYDNGGGKIRGIYAQGNDMVKPIFESWLDPLKDLGAATVTGRNTSGTDHLSFDAVGLPGFQFIQDPLDYSARTHHTQLDTYDRIQSADLMQAAVVMATFVYNAATRRDMLPRKPLPKPQPRPQANLNSPSPLKSAA